MQDSKLIKVLKLLNKEELRRFKKLLQSSFFTTNEHLPKLYTYLIKYAPEFISSKLNKPLLFAYLFPDKKYNDNKLRMLLRTFTRHLEDFLIIKEVRDSEKERKKQLIHIYGKRSQMELFEKGTFRLLEEMKLTPIKDKNHFFEQQQLIQELVYHPATKKSIESVELQTEMLEHLELHYWTNKIWLSCNLLSQKKFLKTTYEVVHLETAIKKIPTAYFQKYPPLSAFKKTFLFLKAPSDTAYFELKESYIEIVPQLSKSNQQDLLVYLMNYAISKWNQGEKIFFNENFELMKVGLKYDLLIESGRLNASIFINACLFAIRSKDFQWVEQFMINYEKYLEEDQKEDIKTLCRGFIYFYQEKYIKLTDLLINYPFRETRDNLRAKALLLRSYFELFLKDPSYFDVFLAYSFSCERFFRRKKSIAKNVIDLYLNLISILRKIAKLIKEKKCNKAELEKIEEKIKEEKIALKLWLVDELTKLKTLDYHN